MPIFPLPLDTRKRRRDRVALVYGQDTTTMADQKVLRVLAGHIDDLPPLSSQIVRIFTSSTFTDTVTERNMLMEQVYPKLKEHCRRQHGLEFQVVDMRWGVRDEAADDHMTSALCLQEIRNCQRVSVGPNFVTFLGQRHGYRPFPTIIESSQFENLIHALKREGERTDLLSQWFLQDANAVPPVHVLQSISSRIPGFLSEDDRTRMTAKLKWTEVFCELQRQLRLASKLCYQQGKITEEQKHEYFMSVTESEIYQGVFLSPGNPSEQCLCFVRIIDDMMENIKHPLAWRYIDMIHSKVDEEAQHLLTKLRDEKLTQKLTDQNISRSRVSWCADGGINREAHAQYLEEFSAHFFRSVKSMIEQGLKSQRGLSQNELYTEVLQHLQMAKDRCAIFCGREDLLGQVRKCLLRSQQAPVVVSGPSGCGKTSVMAKTVTMVRQWIPNGQNAVIVARFLGTSPASCDIRQVLQSLCCQIALNYGQDLPQVPEDLNDLVPLLNKLMRAANPNKPLLVILDSLDQLSSENYAHRLAWLPRDLPGNAYCVVSTLPDEHEILHTLKQKLDSSNFVEVTMLGDNLSLDILGSWLKSNRRTLSPDQYALVRTAFETCSLPLYVKLVFEEVINWRSYTPTNQGILAHTVREVISNLLQRLEKKHGSILVKHALAYLTASKGGLSESELEDILSLDDVVLTDVFQYHVPPVRRMPLILWLRIKNDISSYLVSREADNTTVAYWYHRQFIEAANERYLRGIGFTRERHKILAEYFSGQWHGEEKPFTYTEYQMRKLGLSSCKGSADRKVAAQPIVFGEDVQGEKMYNKRKLNNLPYHLARSSLKQQLKKTCLFNYLWLSTKLTAVSSSLQLVLGDLDLLPQDPECRLLRNALNLGRSTLRNKPSTLAQEILGRLLPYVAEHNSLQTLVVQCLQHAPSANAIVPRQQCYPAPGGSLKYTFENSDVHVNQKLTALSPDSKRLLCVIQQNRMLIWDLSNGEMEREVKLLQKTCKEELDVAYVDSTGEFFVIGCAFHKDVNPIVIVNTTSGDVLHAFTLQKLYPKVGFRDSYRLYISGDKLIVHIHMRTVDCFHVPSGRLLHTLCAEASHTHIMPTNHSILIHPRDSADLEVYEMESGRKLEILPASGTPTKCVTGVTIGNVYVMFKKSAKVDVISNHDKSPSFRISCTLDISQLGHSLVQDISLSCDETLMLITTSTSLIVWKLFGNCLYQKLLIPEEVKPKHRVTSFVGHITPDMRSVVCAYNEHILIWSILHGRLLKTIHATVSLEMNSLMVSADSSLAVTSSERNKTIKVWDLLNFEEQVHFPLALNSAVRYMTVGGDTERPLLLMRTYNPKESRVLDVMSGNIVSAPSRDQDVMTLHITDNGKYAALRGLELEKALSIWNTATGDLVSTIPVSSLYLRSIAIGVKTPIVASHCESSPTDGVEVKLWNMVSGRFISQLPITIGGFGYMFFLNDDKYLAMLRQYPQIDQDQYIGLEDEDHPQIVAGKKCTILIYDVQSKANILTVKNVVKDSLYTLPCGKRIILVQNQQPGDRLVCMDVVSKKIVYTKDRIPSVRLHVSKDGSTAVDTALQVFNLKSGDFVTKFGLPPDGKPLVKQNSQTWPRISADGAYVTWVLVREGLLNLGRVKDGKVIGQCYVHSTPLSIQTCGDRVIACGCDDGRVMLLHIVDSDGDDFKTTVASLTDNALKRAKTIGKELDTLSRSAHVKRNSMKNETDLNKEKTKSNAEKQGSKTCHIL